MKEEKKGADTTDYYPEYTTPRHGEKVQSFAVRDANGTKRIVYVRDKKDGYSYEGKDQKAKKHGR